MHYLILIAIITSFLSIITLVTSDEFIDWVRNLSFEDIKAAIQVFGYLCIPVSIVSWLIILIKEVL